MFFMVLSEGGRLCLLIQSICITTVQNRKTNIFRHRSYSWGCRWHLSFCSFTTSGFYPISRCDTTCYTLLRPRCLDKRHKLSLGPSIFICFLFILISLDQMEKRSCHILAKDQTYTDMADSASRIPVRDWHRRILYLARRFNGCTTNKLKSLFKSFVASHVRKYPGIQGTVLMKQFCKQLGSNHN